MVAARLADVDDLNRRARRLLQDEGDARRRPRSSSAAAPSPQATTSSPSATTTSSASSTAPAPPSNASTPRRHELILADDDGQRLVVPFAYAEAGHLTHGYATTIHKAQGATVDRCFVLADDTITREHAYTALSRGRHGNDLFVVGEDRRIEERHAAEIEPDPLDAVRSVFGRSATKQMATDADDTGGRAAPPAPHGNATASVLNSATDRPTGRGTTGNSPKPSPGRRTAVKARNGASTPPASRCTTSARSAAEPTEPNAASSNAGSRASRPTSPATTRSSPTSKRRLTELTPEMLTRAAWERQHSPELDRLENLDRQITWNEGIERLVARELERGLKRGLDLGHGIEL